MAPVGQRAAWQTRRRYGIPASFVSECPMHTVGMICWHDSRGREMMKDKRWWGSFNSFNSVPRFDGHDWWFLGVSPSFPPMGAFQSMQCIPPSPSLAPSMHDDEGASNLPRSCSLRPAPAVCPVPDVGKGRPASCVLLAGLMAEAPLESWQLILTAGPAVE